MQRLLTPVALALACALPLLANAASVGYRGDGTAVYRDCHPPTSFDEKTGANLLWKADMPNWGHSAPIVVKDRLFVLSEPGWKDDFPLLLCLDANTGKELWRKELNHLAAFPGSEEDRQQIAQAWHDVLARYRLAYRTFNEWTYGDKPAAEKKFADNGFQWKGWRGGGYGQLRSLGGTTDAAKMKIASKAGLILETWQYQCGMGTSCVGQVFATPVSDGEHIYVATAWGSFFCFDLDGSLRWLKFVPGEGSYGGNDYCKNARSPLIYKDLLISDIQNVVRVFDRATGELKWADRIFGAHEIVSPDILTIGDTDVLVCCGMHAYRLPDGKKLAVDGWKSTGGTMLVKYDERDVAFFTGGGEHGGWEGYGQGRGGAPMSPAAVKFALDGDTLKATVLWNGVGGKGLLNHTGITYYDGKLYSSFGAILDPATGQVLQGSVDRRGPRAVPSTGHLLVVAGDYIYGVHEGPGREGSPAQTGVLDVYTLDGKKVAESVLSNAPVEGEKKDQIIEVHGWNTWDFSYACAFTAAGDRLYIRSNDYVYCIGEKK